jgi:hypothetical protein
LDLPRGGYIGGRAPHRSKGLQPYQRVDTTPGSPGRALIRAQSGWAILALLGLATAFGALTGPARAGDEEGKGPLLGATTPAALLAVSPEWEATYDLYEPDAAALEAIDSTLTAQRGDLRVEVILGTWCGDTRDQVPKFLKIWDILGRNRLPATFVGVERRKEKRAAALAGKKIERIPTFIVYRKDEEIGRIVERPKATVEEDLAAILAASRKESP